MGEKRVHASEEDIRERRSNTMEDEQDYEPEIVPIPFGRKVAIGASSALIMAGVPALLHAPLPLEVAGVAAAIALAAKSPALYAHLKEQAPWLDTWLAARNKGEQSVEPGTLVRFFQAFVYGEVRRQSTPTPENGPTAPVEPVRALPDADGQDQQ